MKLAQQNKFLYPMNEFEERVDDLLKTIFKSEIKENKIEINDDISLLNDLGLDSLKVMETALECENKLGIKIKNIEIVRCRTYGNIKDLLVKKLKEKP